MKTISARLSIITALAAFGIPAAHAGDISGTVTLKGTPKPEQEITQIKDDANCGKLHKEPVKTRFYVVGSKGELADVFVTLKGVSGQSAGESAAPAMIDQRLRIHPLRFWGSNRAKDRGKEFGPGSA